MFPESPRIHSEVKTFSFWCVKLGFHAKVHSEAGIFVMWTQQTSNTVGKEREESPVRRGYHFFRAFRDSIVYHPCSISPHCQRDSQEVPTPITSACPWPLMLRIVSVDIGAEVREGRSPAAAVPESAVIWCPNGLPWRKIQSYKVATDCPNIFFLFLESLCVVGMGPVWDTTDYQFHQQSSKDG